MRDNGGEERVRAEAGHWLAVPQAALGVMVTAEAPGPVRPARSVRDQSRVPSLFSTLRDWGDSKDGGGTAGFHIQ